MDQIEPELMALKAQQGRKRRETWKGRKGVPGKLQLSWKIRPPLERLNECYLKDHDIEAKGGGPWSRKGRRKGAERTGTSF